jgi:hypothetical protein
VVVRASVLTAVGGFNLELRRTEDWDLWIRIARTGAPAWVCEPLVAYRFHSGNVAPDPTDMVDEARWIARHYGFPVDLTAMHRRAAWAALRADRRLVAAQYYARAVAGGDLRSLGRAAVALFHPHVGSNRLYELLGRDPDWIARAERWIQAFTPRAQGVDRS